MGGYGSGGRNWKGMPAVEMVPYISVYDLMSGAALRQGSNGVLRIGQSVVRYSTVYSDTILLAASEITYQSFIEFRNLGHERFFGGSDSYLICPHCRSCRRYLYVRNRNFACRVCCKLIYSSQRVGKVDDLFVRLAKSYLR